MVSGGVVYELVVLGAAVCGESGSGEGCPYAVNGS